jgi:hypothetical protein
MKMDMIRNLAIPATAIALAALSTGAYAQVGVAMKVERGFPYFHTGYYHYGPAPLPTVPAARQGEYSFVFAANTGAYSAWSHTVKPSNYRSWSMGYRSFGNFGRYYY